MSFTSEIKNEILSVRLNGVRSRRAFVSAVLRTCGSIESVSDKIGFSVVSEPQTIKFFVKTVAALYGERCETEEGVLTKNRATARLISENSLAILIDLGILKSEDGGIAVCLNISEEMVSDENSFKAYLIGAFLGSGSITVPKLGGDKKSKTGYHLEIVFSKYVTASDFCRILAERDFMPRLVERKDRFVVYFKTVEEIETLIGICGASAAYLKLTEVQIQKEIRSAENRKINCELSNMKQKDDIRLIDGLIGLDKLKKPLKEVAVARLNSDDDVPMQQLADALGITKSCLFHRLKKLSEIAQTLK